MYQTENSFANAIYNNENVIVVDLRSDTLTKPTKRMREAMFNAEVGDDVYGEDPTVKKLEEKAAEMVGKEAAIFVTSGTMGNLIARVSLRPLKNKHDGTFELSELKSYLRSDNDHEPISKLVIVENTTNGIIVPQTWIEELVTFCKKHNLKLHMDGARIWNASVGSGIPVKEIVSGFDSVTFCLSKGLGAPAGSLLCGSKAFVVAARRARKALGGGMRQVGVLAAAGLVAIEDSIPILKYDHERAFLLASSINEIQSKVFSVHLSTVQTNMIFIQVDKNIASSQEFVNRLREVNDDNDDDKIIVKCSALNDSSVRLVICYEITDRQLMLASKKIKYVIQKLDMKC
ncbi:uncharacterized protein LOC143179280 isoform X3 [Calliopsis andreniformis]|uniref:uncharacterized protein LOC143179280 isoform X3 n=1 Tax=Calliopsis andreniformis TaxID=337506 RepID=UPI003FCCCB21